MLESWLFFVNLTLLVGGIGYLGLRLHQLHIASAAVRQSEERYALIAQSTNDGLWDWDMRTDALYVSPRFKEMLGYTEHELELTFATFAAWLHPDDQAYVREQIRAHGEHHLPFVVEYRLCAKDGEYRWFHARGHAAWDERGQPIRMAGSLREVTERREAETYLRTSTQVLATSLTQIRTSLTQLLASTMETVNAVAQTAATVEEVKQTASACGHQAQGVTENAQQTVAITQSGEQAVEAAVAGMERVRDQIESIADEVLQLGERTRAIEDIIATVTEWAEQSNLLAVNAAIEAARAGDQGKGFGIVAQEVRHLATQSKQATARIRTILKEIQQAARTAVLVTREGTQAITAGVTQAIEATQSIHSLSHNIRVTAQAVAQIAVSSQDQVIGMKQAAGAMANIKTASDKNLAGLRQIGIAVQQLQGVGQTLQALIEQRTGRNSASTDDISPRNPR
jgi:PAS domain S-box-containing protein